MAVISPLLTVTLPGTASMVTLSMDGIIELSQMASETVSTKIQSPILLLALLSMSTLMQALIVLSNHLSSMKRLKGFLTAYQIAKPTPLPSKMELKSQAVVLQQHRTILTQLLSTTILQQPPVLCTILSQEVCLAIGHTLAVPKKPIRGFLAPLRTVVMLP